MLENAGSRRAALLTIVTVLGTTVAAALAPGRQVAESVMAQDQPVTVYIVRHAERASTHPTDPPLDSIGKVRAIALRETLRDAGVSAIYVTQYIRNRETAAPLAEALGLEVREVRVEGSISDHAREVARMLIEDHRGEAVVVVGHSNTIGPIARALGADAPGALEDHEYEHLFIVSTDGTTPVRFVRARFGPPNPPPRETPHMR